MIAVSHLTKHYRVHERPPGLAAALRSIVKRTYKTVRAVDDVTFEIAPGERVGFLGPNGAGKTTTLKMLSGLLHPTSGTARVLGYEPRKREVSFLRSIMLVTGQKQQLLWDLPPIETFELNRAIYDVPRDQYNASLAEMTELLDLGELVRKPTRQLSLGERMKCELAAALLHRPKVLFLDEPTIGLDVTMQAAVRGFIKTYNERHNATVMLTSHYMDDVAALCKRVLVIDRGQLTYDGTLDALVQRLRPEKRVTLRLGTSVTDAEIRSLCLETGARLVSNGRESEPSVHPPATSKAPSSSAFAHVVVQAQGEGVKRFVQAAFSKLVVLDLKVEDAPLEEVLAELFATSTVGSALAAVGGVPPRGQAPEAPIEAE